MMSFPTRVNDQVIDSTWFNPLQTAVDNIRGTRFFAAEYASIQAAIDAANAVGGGMVLIGPGTFDVELTIYDHIHLVGSGLQATILRLPNATNGSAVISSDGFATKTGTTSDAGTRWFSISNLKIDGNRLNNTAGRGIQLYGYEYRINGLWILDAPEEGLWGEFGGQSLDISQAVQVNGLKIGKCGASGLRWKGPTDCMFHHCVTYRNNQNSVGGSGFWLDSGSALAEFEMCHSWGITQEYAARVDGGSVQFDQCNMESGALAEIYVGGNNFRMTGGLLHAGNVSSQVALEIDTTTTGHVINTKTADFVNGTLIKWTGAQTSNYADIVISDHDSTGVIESGNRPSNAVVQVVAEIMGLSLPVSLGQMELKDDFLSGGTGTGNIGELGWDNPGPGGTVFRDSETGHPGIVRRTTSATAGSYAIFHLSTYEGLIPPTETFDTVWVLRPGDADIDTTLRVGIANDSTLDPPADGIYFEKLAADTNWFAVTRASSIETRTDTGVAVSTLAFSRFRIRRVNASTIGFSLDGGTEIEHTTNIPTTLLNPFTAIGNNTAATNKTLDHDHYNVRITGLSR